ncbi:hypothetical protein ABT030_38975 [Streptomyces mirabilis]
MAGDLHESRWDFLIDPQVTRGLRDREIGVRVEQGHGVGLNSGEWTLNAVIGRPLPTPTEVGVRVSTTRGEVPAARPGAVEATAMEKENRQLQARVKELELEREILRRAAKYFAAETSW